MDDLESKVMDVVRLVLDAKRKESVTYTFRELLVSLGVALIWYAREEEQDEV